MTDPSGASSGKPVDLKAGPRRLGAGVSPRGIAKIDGRRDLHDHSTTSTPRGGTRLAAAHDPSSSCRSGSRPGSGERITRRRRAGTGWVGRPAPRRASWRTSPALRRAASSTKTTRSGVSWRVWQEPAACTSAATRDTSRRLKEAVSGAVGPFDGRCPRHRRLTQQPAIMNSSHHAGGRRRVQAFEDYRASVPHRHPLGHLRPPRTSRRAARAHARRSAPGAPPREPRLVLKVGETRAW